MDACNFGVAEDHAMFDVGVDDGDAIANAGIKDQCRRVQDDSSHQ